MKYSKQRFTFFITIFLISVLTSSLINTNSQVIDPTDMGWTELSPANVPLGRDSHLIVYDPNANKVIMFGGWSDTSDVTYINDTWIFDPSTRDWTNVTSSVNPGARGYIKGVYDPTTQESIFFGGFNETMNFRDTWAFDYNGFSWRNISTPVSPTPRGYYGADFSTRNNTLVMFGGSNDFTGFLFNETWTYTSTAGWVNRTTSNTPDERSASHLVYDEMHDKFILFGGFRNNCNIYA